MLLKPVSFLDIAVFLLFLSFYILRDSNIFRIARCGLCVLPFLCEFERNSAYKYTSSSVRQSRNSHSSC